MDVVSVYLEGQLEEELYMRVPESLQAPNKTCRLLKGLYGLKQSGRVWNKTIAATFNRLGFCAADADNTV